MESCTFGVWNHVPVVYGIMYTVVCRVIYLWCMESCTCGVSNHVPVVYGIMYLWCMESCTCGDGGVWNPIP